MEGASTAATLTEREATRDGSKRYYSAFLLCWAVAWSLDTFDWTEALYRDQWGRQLWLNWTVDTMENFCLAASAYVLFRGVQFRWNDRYLKIACALFPAIILAGAVPFYLVSPDNQLLRLPALSLDLIVTIGTTFAVGIAIFRELHGIAHRARWIVLTVFFVIAILHIPSSLISLTERLQRTAVEVSVPAGLGVPNFPNSEPRQVIRTLLAIAKIALFFAMFSTLAWFYHTVLTVAALRTVQMTAAILGTACSVFLAAFSFVRVFHRLTG